MNNIFTIIPHLHANTSSFLLASKSMSHFPPDIIALFFQFCPINTYPKLLCLNRHWYSIGIKWREFKAQQALTHYKNPDPNPPIGGYYLCARLPNQMFHGPVKQHLYITEVRPPYGREHTHTILDFHYSFGLRQGRQRVLYQGDKILREEYCEKDLLHGPQRVYDTTGILRIKATYRRGKEQGYHAVFYESGTLHIESYYKRGKLHGRQRVYLENGTLSEERHFREGKMHGWSRVWWPPYCTTAGQIVRMGLSIKTRYIGGELKEERRWNPCGELLYNKKM